MSEPLAEGYSWIEEPIGYDLEGGGFRLVAAVRTAEGGSVRFDETVSPATFKEKREVVGRLREFLRGMGALPA